VQLLIIRHGIAVERGAPGMADDDRPLTAEGEKKFRAAAKGLAAILEPPQALLSSPLPRAYRTAEIAAQAWGGLLVKKTRALLGGTLEELVETLSKHPPDSTVAVFGHEPHLSGILAGLLGSPRGEGLSFRKGGAALVELPGGPSEGGQLVWFLPPKLLKRLGE